MSTWLIPASPLQLEQLHVSLPGGGGPWGWCRSEDRKPSVAHQFSERQGQFYQQNVFYAARHKITTINRCVHRKLSDHPVQLFPGVSISLFHYLFIHSVVYQHSVADKWTQRPWGLRKIWEENLQLRIPFINLVFFPLWVKKRLLLFDTWGGISQAGSKMIKNWLDLGVRERSETAGLRSMSFPRCPGKSPVLAPWSPWLPLTSQPLFHFPLRKKMPPLSRS